MFIPRTKSRIQVLAIILGNAELTIMGPDHHRESLEDIKVAALRGRDLVRQLLTFSRKTDIQRAVLDPAPVIKEVLKFIRSTLPSSIDINAQVESQGMRIFTDSTHLHQMVMNLCTNAGQAMGEGGGRLTVSLEQVSLDRNQASRQGVNPGDYARLTVQDNGPGMDPEVMKRIFDPFFTTKGLGKGTGLGLSVVHGVVQDCGGSVQVESKLGRGSLFRIHLPLMKRNDSPDRQEDEPEVYRGVGRILFVDDEQGLVELGIRILSTLGYSPVGFHDPKEALAHFLADPQAFDAVITDQVMPGLTGHDLAVAMLEAREDIPIFLCTGFSERMNEESAAVAGFRRFFLKPVPLAELSQALKEVLGR